MVQDFWTINSIATRLTWNGSIALPFSIPSRMQRLPTGHNFQRYSFQTQPLVLQSCTASGLFSPPNTLYPSPSRVKWSNAQIFWTQHGIVRKRHFVSNLLWFSTITSQFFHGRRRRPGNAFACQNPLKARAPERPRNDLGGLGKPVEKNPWKTAKKKRCIFHIFWGQWVYISYTSRAAWGGGGSFKNRKRIGEIGCCESWMTKRKHWRIWLTAELSNWLTG